MNTTVATAAPLLAGRVALVLGANGGIGSAIARRLPREHASSSPRATASGSRPFATS